MTGSCDVSLVLPVYDETDSLRQLHEEITGAMQRLGLAYEILFVDDGSRDGSASVLDALADSDPTTRVIRFRRNFGKAAALDAGWRAATGRILVTMDADLQDDPAEIPRLLDALAKGWDMVAGRKTPRRDPISKRVPSWVFNRMVGWLSGLQLHDMNSGFKAMRSEVVEDMALYGELHRFIPVLAHARGYAVTEIPVSHRARLHGRSKYGSARLFKGFFDLLTVTLSTRFASRPLHLFGWIGLLFTSTGFGILVYLTYLWFDGVRPIGTRPLLFLGLLLLMVGVQVISTGLIAELIVRREQQERRSYVIMEPGARRPGHQQLSEVSDPEPADAERHKEVREPHWGDGG